MSSGKRKKRYSDKPVVPASFAAVLSDFARRNGVTEEEMDEEATDSSAAAVLLKPYLDKLAEIDKDVKPFPPGSHSGPWAEIEAEVLDPRATESILQIGKRWGMTKRHIYRWSVRRRWGERRQVLLEIQARRTAAASVVESSHPATRARRRARAKWDEKRVLNIIDRALAVFEEGLENGMVQLRNAKDLDTLVRLAKFVQGEAERIVEQRSTMTARDLAKRVRAVAKSMNVDAALAGVVTDAEFRVVEDEDDAVESVPPTAPNTPDSPPWSAPSPEDSANGDEDQNVERSSSVSEPGRCSKR